MCCAKAGPIESCFAGGGQISTPRRALLGRSHAWRLPMLRAAVGVTRVNGQQEQGHRVLRNNEPFG